MSNANTKKTHPCIVSVEDEYDRAMLDAKRDEDARKARIAEAAPEMLIVLRKLRGSLLMDRDGGVLSERGALNLIALDAIIAKATGVQS